jgi:hypothetical protein
MFGFIKKRLTRPREAASIEKMTNLKQEEDLVLANSRDKKPKYSYHNSFELPRFGIYYTVDTRHERGETLES